MNIDNNTKDRELIFTRLFNAPRELVFEVWTNPEHLKHWWGPNGFTNTIHEMNVSPGGIFSLTMHGPDGRNYLNRIIFIEVAKPERLVYRHTGDIDTEPVMFHVTITFEEIHNKTLLTLHFKFNTKEERDFVINEYQADEGAIQMLSRLEKYLQRNSTNL